MRDTRATTRCWVLLREIAAWLIIYRLMLCVCEIIMYVKKKRWLLLEKYIYFIELTMHIFYILFHSNCFFRFFSRTRKALPLMCYKPCDTILRIYLIYYFIDCNSNMYEQIRYMVSFIKYLYIFISNLLFTSMNRDIYASKS